MRTLHSLLALVLLSSCGGSTVTDAGVDAAPDARRPCTMDVDCDDGVYCNGPATCVPGVGCLAGALPCRAGQVCSEVAHTCTTDCGATPDADGDGHPATLCGGDDCDDADRSRYPGNAEVCDVMDRDEDCDPLTFGVRDADGDSIADARCCNVAGDVARHCGTDCDDTNPSVHPGLPEVCNDVDDDCNGMIDDGLPGSWTIDVDHDGHGSNATGAATMSGCMMPAGYASSHDDCDDANAGTHPGEGETCNAVDDDCNMIVDDAPGGCDCSSGSRPCALSGVCAAGAETCVTGHWSACSIMPTTETCNMIDDDCDGIVDNGLTHLTCYPDGDADGYAAMFATATTATCRDPSRAGSVFGGCPTGYTARAPGMTSATDCCDSDSGANPTVTALFPIADACGSFDWNCDGAETGEEYVTNACMNGNCNPGWVGSTLPPCGGMSYFIGSCTGTPLSCAGSGASMSITRTCQ